MNYFHNEYARFLGVRNIARLLSLTLLLHSSPLSSEENGENLSLYSIPTSSASPCVIENCQKTPAKFFAIGEYLYWQANVSGLELSFGRSSVTQGTVNSINTTENSEFDTDPDFEWNSGYRVGAGVQLPDSNISFEAAWTQFSDKGHKTVHGASGIINKGHAKVSLEQIDAIMVYTYALPRVNIEPFVGVRATKINHSVKSSVTTNITLLPSTLASGLLEFDDHQNFKGIGPSLGLYGDWNFFGNFGIYGEAAFSVLYGDYSVNFNDATTYSTPLSSESTAITHQHLQRFNKTVDLGLGLFWSRPVCKGMEIGFRLGYEFHQYCDLSYLGSYRGDVAFSGGIFSLEIGF